MLTRVIILQDLENFHFLCPSPDGDVMYTPYLKKAGFFLSEEEAHDTAELNNCEQYQLFSFFVDASVVLLHRQ